MTIHHAESLPAAWGNTQIKTGKGSVKVVNLSIRSLPQSFKRPGLEPNGGHVFKLMIKNQLVNAKNLGNT